MGIVINRHHNTTIQKKRLCYHDSDIFKYCNHDPTKSIFLLLFFKQSAFDTKRKSHDIIDSTSQTLHKPFHATQRVSTAVLSCGFAFPFNLSSPALLPHGLSYPQCLTVTCNPSWGQQGQRTCTQKWRHTQNLQPSDHNSG